MIYYEKEIIKNVESGKLSKKVFDNIYKTLKIVKDSKELGLFDIKPLNSKSNIRYYRLRKGKYRAIFYIENEEYHVIIPFSGNKPTELKIKSIKNRSNEVRERTDRSDSIKIKRSE